MRNLLAFLGAAVLVFFGVGLYLGWYHIYRGPTSTPGHSRIEFDINQDKISSDVKQGTDKIKDAIDKATNDPNAATTPATPPDSKPSSSAATTNKVDAAKNLIRDASDWYSPESKKK